MNMRKIEIDISRMSRPDQIQEYIKKQMGCPQYYGENLNALYDFMTDICEDTCITLVCCQDTASTAYGYNQKVRRAMEEAQEENEHLVLLVKEKAGSGIFKHQIRTAASQDMMKITDKICQDLAVSGVVSGIAVVYSPHTTAGITINENADPDVVHDMIYGYERVFPTADRAYRHAEGNSHAHMKATAFGASKVILIENGALILGIWQDVYFCEFDGPRNRTYYVKIIDC